MLPSRQQQVARLTCCLVSLLPACAPTALPASTGVATVNVGNGNAAGTVPGAAHEAAGFGGSPAVIQIVKKGAGVINRTDLSSIEPQPWGSYSAAQAWGDKLWFAVVAPEEVVTGSGSGKAVKAGVWVGATNL